MPGLMTTPLGEEREDPEGWPKREGFTAHGSDWWCDGCGAHVRRGWAVRHEEFHARVGG